MAKTQKIKISNVRFENFKAFEQYTVSLSEANILVGPNNSGKSTIISAFRALDSAIKIARSRPPSRVFVGEASLIGYHVPEDSLPMSLENVHTNYNSQESRIIFTLSNNNRLSLIFPEDGGCVLLPEARGAVITTTATFKRCFPITLTVVPVLGPVEHREIRRERSTVVGGLSTHRASRHFRSYWHYFEDGFEDFRELIERTWPHMHISQPEFNSRTGELSMFILEGRMTRELYWVGFGFQIWCQLLTHLSRSTDSTMIVADEPETYLHPDVQRQLLGILREIGPAVLLATHSTEIMSEADPNEIIMIDKNRRVGERFRDVAGIQRALEAVGSNQNITLTALARSRRVLFVEGNYDFGLIRRFARKLGMRELGAGLDITPLPSGGFSSWQKVTVLASGIADVLGSPLIIAAVYDRDYFCQEFIGVVLGALHGHLPVAHVHARKEIENYLLVPDALDRAIEQTVGGVDQLAVNAFTTAADLLREITDPLRDSVQSQLQARRWDHFRHSGRDLADVNREALAGFGAAWNDLQKRLELVPGKEVLAQFRTRVQESLGISLTDSRVIDAMRRDEIPADLVDLLRRLDNFRRAPVAD
jgi:energy-coupling factor transporter ATP-binding protein EcfA2